jgi:biuret amidohydrolase
MGYDLSLTQAPIGPIKRVLQTARAKSFQILHTREGHRPDLSDLPANKQWRSRRIGAGIVIPGPAGEILTRAEPGWEIIPDVAPPAGESIVDKPGKGSFYGTDLDMLLQRRGIQHIVLCGITTQFASIRSCEKQKIVGTNALFSRIPPPLPIQATMRRP